MRTAGIDVGHRTTKIVVLEDGKMIGKHVMANSDQSDVAAQKIMDAVTRDLGMGMDDVDYIVSTGSMGKEVKFAHLYRTSMACLARGVYAFFPEARTIIDLGAETCTVMKLNPGGSIIDMQSNDKCAAGTGIYIEAMAKLLGVPTDQIGVLATQGSKSFEISSMCVVFAEQEIISNAHENPDISAADLAASMHASIAARVAGLAKRLTVEDQVILTGGCAKNPGYVKHISQELGAVVKVPRYPQELMAYGAAMIAQEKGRK